MTTPDYTAKITQQVGDKNETAYEVTIKNNHMKFFRMWQGIIEMQKEMTDGGEFDPSTLNFTAPIENTGGDATYLNLAFEYAENIENGDFPKERLLPADQSTPYQQQDFDFTEFEKEFFKRVLATPSDPLILKRMLPEEKQENYPEDEADSVVCLLWVSNFYGFTELMEACAKFIATQMQNKSIEELQRMFKTNEQSEQAQTPAST